MDHTRAFLTHTDTVAVAVAVAKTRNSSQKKERAGSRAGNSARHSRRRRETKGGNVIPLMLQHDEKLLTVVWSCLTVRVQ